jgi:Tol biopolymer transport system component
MSTRTDDKGSIMSLEEKWAGWAPEIGRRQALLKIVAILVVLTLVLLLTTAITPTPVGFAAAFPGQNGKFVVTMPSMVGGDLNDWEIYVTANGKHLKRLTDNSEFDYYPAWSPDGKRIAFSRRDPDGNYDLYVMKANGKKEMNLTNTPKIDEVVPSWSPDGNKIAFCAYPDGEFDFGASEWKGMEIYVMDADGSNETRLTDNDAEDYGPTWSPDGAKIAFTTNRDDDYEVYVMNADGSDPTNLTNDLAADGWWAPYWSPDGTKIAFVSDRDGNSEIYVMDADGGNPVNLTNNAEWDGLPVWSPDGKKIAFKSTRDGGNWELFEMDADTGSDPTRLTDTGGQVRAFDWQPLGHRKK